MSSTSPGTFPGTTSWTSADGKHVVDSRHARVSPSRTAASTAHCRPFAYMRVARCSSSRCSRSSSEPDSGAAMSGSLCPQKIAAFPSTAVTVSPTWYSRAVSWVWGGVRCPLTSDSSTTRRAPRCRTVYRTTTPGCSSSGTSESDPSASVRTSTDPPAGTRCQVIAARPVGVSCVSEGDRSYRPHLAVTLITSTVAGTLNASPMAEADIDPERMVASASAPSSSPPSPDAGEATSRSTSSGSSCSSSAGCSGCCRGTSRPSMYRSAGKVPGGSSSSGPSHGPSRSRSRRSSSSARTWNEVASGVVTTGSPACSAGGSLRAVGPATRTEPPYSPSTGSRSSSDDARS